MGGLFTLKLTLAVRVSMSVTVMTVVEVVDCLSDWGPVMCLEATGVNGTAVISYLSVI